MSSNKRLSDPSSITSLASTSSSSPFPKRLRLSDPSSITPGASASSSSIQKGFKYDVFISFRGEDTRKTFVGHLYQALKDKGIYTYKDDERIEQGKTINNQLIQAIRGSRFFIIVFSQNYASSSWCLDELVEIMECQKTGEQTAYPVFLDVEPTEVRKQSGAFGEAFSQNKNKDAAGKWIEALKGAADLAGRELQAAANGYEAEFIKKIVGEISLELRSISFGFDEKLVGMETRVKDVVSDLEIGIDEVRMIGIKGMGGAGKTTTARAVFDLLSADFEAKSFVANVREVSEPSMSGLKKLQEQVLSRVLNEQVTLDSVYDGKNMMQERMQGIKVLLVLDDVNHIDQLEALAEPNWFKPGSRIIITTRDEQVLVAHRVNFIRVIDLLSDKEAICLFSRYAFGREIPSQGYEELSRRVVLYAAGLPLTVKVLGSFLCGKDKDEWVDAIERLKKIPLKETLKQLELSYMSLEDDYKEIFLDIACILKGKHKKYAIRILECCGFHAINGLKVLEQRSLITVDEYGCLDMHDHIEEMGKNIVRREHPNEPNKHSRLWINEEIEDILANDEGTEATICLELPYSNTNAGTVMKGLGKMKQLRYLHVYFQFQRSPITVNEDGFLGMHDHIEEMGNNIVRCEHPNEPNKHSRLWIEEEIEDILANDENTEATICLALFKPNTNAGSVMKGLGKIKMKPLRYPRVNFQVPNYALVLDNTSQYFPNSLKYLKCTNYPFLYLPKTFQANNLVGLEMNWSIFSNNSRMEQLWEEGEKKVLTKLKFLSMSGSKLRTFDLGLTPNLEKLSLNDCADFEELHVSSACPNLKFLELRKSRLRSLDLELFPNLERLDLKGCDKLVEINAPVGCLRKLVYLNLDLIKVEEPKVSHSSASLRLVGKSLDLCPLHPDNNLPKFGFYCIYEENLPSSVGNIEKLISFGLCTCTDFKKFSDMICSLRCLRKLELQRDIPEIPKDLGKLECLEELCLLSTKIKHLPDSICMLKCLKFLVVDTGDLLEKLPENLGQLECLERLHVRSKKIKHLPDSICMLKCLKCLEVDTGDLLEKLPDNLGQLECLEQLYVRSKKIEYLPDSICMLKRLTWLDVSDCSCLGKLPEDIGQLESLEILNLTATKIKHLPDSICMLKCLKSLKVNNYDPLEKLLQKLPEALLQKLPEDLGQLESLEKLYVWSEKIEYLPDSICMLKRLKSLDVGHCSCLGKLPEDIGQLESLERLGLSDTKIKHLPDSICMLKHLKILILSRCTLLQKLPEDLGKLECLEELHVWSGKIEYLPDSICMLKRLKSLYVRKCCLGKLPEDIGQLESLENLDLSATKIKHLPDSICMLKHLKFLYLRDCALLEKLPEDLGKLECFFFRDKEYNLSPGAEPRYFPRGGKI